MCIAAVSQFASDINNLFQNDRQTGNAGENDNGVTYTSILLNNAIESPNDSALISNAQNRISGSNVGSYQRVGVDSLTDRNTRRLFGFNYFRLGTQSTNPFPSPSDQRRIMIINGNTREVLFSFTPTGSASDVRNQVISMRQTMINAVNSVVNVEPDPFADWVAATGIPEALSADTADADGDGLTNLLEYAFGTDPISNSADDRPRIELVNGSPRFVYQQNTSADISSFIVRMSPDLSAQSFTIYEPDSSSVQMTSLSAGAGGETPQRIEISLPAELSRAFFTVEVAR